MLNKDRNMILLVIDIQKGIADNRLFNFDSFIQDTKKIIDAARDNNVEIIYDETALYELSLA
jgi:nicotinamidase-related amidase